MKASQRFIEGWRLGISGQQEGVPLLLEGIAVLNALGTRMNLPFFLLTLAEVYGKLGRAEEGLDRLAEAFAVMESTHERWAESEAHRIRGTLLASLGDQDGAEKSYRQALVVAEPQKAISWSLRAALDLAKLWRAQGKTEDARSLLSPIYESFKEGFDTPFLVDAKSLLADLSASTR